MPVEILFPSQLPDEKIVIVVREHWFRLFIKVLAVAFLFALPWLVKMLLVDTSILETSVTASNLATAFVTIYYLALLIALFIVFVLYYLNLHIVSENRVVDIDQVGLLSHVVSELNIETIEDVTSQTNGLFGNILNYGTVYIQTAGTVERFEFDNVPNPEAIAKVVLELYEQHEGKEQSEA